MTACLLSLITSAHYLSRCTSPYHCYQIQYIVFTFHFLTLDRETAIWNITRTHTHTEHLRRSSVIPPLCSVLFPYRLRGEVPGVLQNSFSERPPNLGWMQTNTESRHTPYLFFFFFYYKTKAIFIVCPVIGRNKNGPAGKPHKLCSANWPAPVIKDGCGAPTRTRTPILSLLLPCLHLQP